MESLAFTKTCPVQSFMPIATAVIELGEFKKKKRKKKNNMDKMEKLLLDTFGVF